MASHNLFLNTRKLTNAKEDHLTEFLAAMILMNEPFNTQFSELLLGEYASSHGWDTPIIVTVETQASYSGTNCCPDMRFTLADGHVILCENKIEAPETMGSSADPRGSCCAIWICLLTVWFIFVQHPAAVCCLRCVIIRCL